MFLDALGGAYELLFVEENGRILLGAVVLMRNGVPVQASYPYQGVMFGAEIAGEPNHRRVKYQLEIVEFLLAEMEKKYDAIAFAMHYNFDDMRPFQWFHYHESEKGLFDIRLAYTGLINLGAYTDFDSYLASIRSVRRNEYRRVGESGASVEESGDIELLDRLHKATFLRQGVQRDVEEGRWIRSVAESALSNGYGKLLVCRNVDGMAMSATLFLFDASCGYYFIGANDPVYRNSGSGVYLFLENVRRCFEMGVKKIDVVGINSPNRGDFKTSFNAAIKPYFQVDWQRP